MSQGLWPAVVQADVAANRPLTLELPVRVFGFYLATDTGAISIWNPATAAWQDQSDQATFYTVATLPASPKQGQREVVTDATTPALGATVAGAGAVIAEVIWNGANWKVI